MDAILAAAEEVFADVGLHAARMDTIAAKAGVSVGTLYNHFEDREALVAGLLTARRRELVGQIDGAVGATAEAPLRARLRAILAAFSSHCQAHRKFVNIVLQHELGSHHRSFVQARARKLDTMREIQNRIEEQMKRGVKEGALRPEVGDLAATFFLGMLRALILRDLALDAGAGTMAADTERLLDTFFAGAGSGAARRLP
ncbi:MAG TPA: TetR/AcrR family transcriptional regulator [Polyangia bacterium]